MIAGQAEAPDLALVAFSGRAALPWLRVLRPGFRHCFVLVRAGARWAVVDPMSHYTLALPLGDYPLRPLVRALRAVGLTILLVRPRVPAAVPQAWRPYTCVEAVKRVLGLHAPWVLTPWQLFRFLGRDRRRAAVTPSGARR